MSKDIRIKKGLDIRLVGEAEKTISEGPRSRTITIRPSDFHLVTPKMAVKEGATLKAGDEIFYSKSQEEIKFVSPVAGKITEIKRGARRVITDIVIEADYDGGSRDLGALSASATGEAIKARLLEGGVWPFVKQRPYDVVANPTVTPKAIFISGLKYCILLSSSILEGYSKIKSVAQSSEIYKLYEPLISSLSIIF